jgi:hypothetical protein
MILLPPQPKVFTDTGEGTRSSCTRVTFSKSELKFWSVSRCVSNFGYLNECIRDKSWSDMYYSSRSGYQQRWIERIYCPVR